MVVNKKPVVIYTDGACSHNPGPGGWAALLMYQGKEKMVSGYVADTTNNRMELQAAISGLKSLKGSRVVDLWTDSQYVRRGMIEWLPGWAANGWKNAQKKDIKNKDLWVELWTLAQKHQVKWHWVKGHSGDEYNERVDEAARKAIEDHR
ncbi:ribonuclease HI [Candidatus Comchoanobacter bicostacola]|uniref:Ribonuclease H n=1 Tax=Candidatus Comchoanobacter bicostacola TaxID=2919598 RepID=A0ABY5DI68_9GAMM|nr:ribonuclease HI [Candidatus Comchoanobacter bicostacola]UTC24318.1 ribonuclease HI [Candidatus Comchoanobacter bicostacola]